jgi:hypothetical protein
MATFMRCVWAAASLLCSFALGCGSSGGANDEQAAKTDPFADVGECDWPEEETVALDAGAVHVDGPVDYGPGAPAGGDHSPCWGTWGVHDAPLPAENFVHNLEHGGVALLYNCPKGCSAEVSALEQFVAGHELTIMTEYPELEQRFAVTAWGYRVESACLSEAGLQAFYDAHVDQGPEQFGRPPPDPPASCE